MTEPDVPDALHELRRLVLVFATCIALLFAYTLYQSYSSRSDLHAAQVAACERGKLDRKANAEGWRAAELVRRQSGTPNDIVAADDYDRIADGLEERGRIDCHDAFPGASLWR